MKWLSVVASDLGLLRSLPVIDPGAVSGVLRSYFRMEASGGIHLRSLVLTAARTPNRWLPIPTGIKMTNG